MDRGASRSRKRAEKASKTSAVPDTPAPAPKQRDVKALPGGSKGGKPKGKGKAGPSSKPVGGVHPERAERKRKAEEQSKDPANYTAKAIRSAKALVFSQEAFTIPPPAERLAGVTRVDLEGSGATDVSWLAGSSVTWLSLKGCEVVDGWEAVGGLADLSVLNISATGITTLPKPLANLSKLKALVAMSNEFSTLDHGVVSGWKELNSIIVSHSPNLTSLPASLAELSNLSKLTLSHCPLLSAAGLPDLSALPHLRDVKANNLPRLTSLPAHLATWGTGVMSSDKDGAPRRGQGLEVLDLGNCSLPFAAVSKIFGLAGKSKTPQWGNLRSLTLRANPLALEKEDYAELLQASADLPKLQIIDSRRVVERKRKGETPETKSERRARERKEAKMRPTGANETGGGAMRTWGKGDAEAEQPKEKKRKAKGEEGEERSVEKKRKAKGEDAEKAEKKRKAVVVEDKAEARPKRVREDKPEAEAKAKKPKATPRVVDADPEAPAPKKRKAAPALAAPAATAPTPTDPSAAKPKKPSRNETAVVGVVEVGAGKGERRPKSKTGVDLKAVFGGGVSTGGGGDDEASGSGLGVGGW
ncbi:uncharacterized protein LOC62_02G002328 [Vanrija pseudolonga]|uniref:L domain-like protein n=1 Tax=Vanrija pseudolonga TaxID=143232 RepID=A0AAF0Y2C2_9TREE|nr:hypothetical protein LOC62_02G002328 [Vanrija pseudolonga]